MIANVVRNCFPVAAKVVADKADEINKLNVFPVPDGPKNIAESNVLFFIEL